MSQTSEEESLFNFQQQQKLALCEAALSKGDPIIHAGKKRRGHPGQPGKVTVVAYIVSVFMSSTHTFNYHKAKNMMARKMDPGIIQV